MIGELYDVNNVVVGQAAVLFAAEGTQLPDVATANLDDAFDLSVWFTYALTFDGTAEYTITDDMGNETTALTFASDASAVEDALNALDNGVTYTVSGASSPFTIAADEYHPLSITVTAGTATLTGGLWTPCGATDQGWQYAAAKSTQTIQIEEQSTPVGMTIQTQSVSLQGALSEDISRTLTLAYNAAIEATAADTDTPAYDTISLSDDIKYYAVVLLTTNEKGYPRWVYAPKWSQLSQVSTAFRRAADKRTYPVAFETLCKPSQIQILNFTDVATG